MIDALLNHKSGTIKGVSRFYNRAQFIKPKSTALQSWGDYLEGIVSRRERVCLPVSALADRNKGLDFTREQSGVGTPYPANPRQLYKPGLPPGSSQ